MRYSLLFLLAPLAPLGAQVSPPQTPVPATKMEGFHPVPGAITQMSYSVVGVLEGATVMVQVLCQPPAPAVRGVAVMITDTTQGQRETSLIDPDELAGLIRGIDSLLTITKSPTQLESFETTYMTKGGFQIAAYGDATSDAVRFGLRVVKEASSAWVSDLDAEELKAFRGFLGVAKGKLTAMGS